MTRTRGITQLTRTLIAVLAVLALAGAGAGAAQAQAGKPTWQLEQPPSYGGGPPGPLGAPAALTFVAPNRGLLETGGSGGNPAGLWTYNGQSWSLLANVCGSDPSGEYGAIAPAGQDDFWTVSDPAPLPTSTSSATVGTGGQADHGTTLCHFQNGQVVASYAVPANQSETYLPMRAAACLSASDCWFGGTGGNSGSDGLFSGTFHLHWDGTQLTEEWAPQDRAVSSMSVFGGAITQTSVLGQRPFTLLAAAPTPADNDANAPLVQDLDNGAWDNDPYITPAAGATTGNYADPQSTWDQVDINDSQASVDGSQLWLAGGPAESGGTYGDNGSYDGWWSSAYPFLAVRERGGPLVPLTFDRADTAMFDAANTTFTSVAPIPGTNEAWVGVETLLGPMNTQASTNDRYQAEDARLLEIQYNPSAPAGQPNATIVQDVTPADGFGAVMRAACPAANQCWAATTSGWLLHWSDGTPLPVDNDPAYSQLISIRPPDGRSPQPVATGDPFDDSDLYEHQPLAPVVQPATPAAPTPPAPVAKKIGVLIRSPRSRAVGQREIEVSFELMRPAKVGLEGYLHGREVAHTAERKLIPGDQRLYLTVRAGWRPTKLSFLTKELALEAPTLATSARRSGRRAVKVTLSAPGAGRVTVQFNRDNGHAATGAAFIHKATLSKSHKLTTSLTLPAALAQSALMVHFAFTASAGQAGVPKSLTAQRLLAALPAPPHRVAKKKKADAR